MAIKDIFKISRKTFFYPSAWIGTETLSQQTSAMWLVIKSLFTPEKPVHKETFAESMQRQGLTEADIKEAQDDYTFYALIFLVLGIALVVFAFYLLFTHAAFFAWLLALAAAGLSLVQALKYDFWAFQIKNRKLGCTLAEWKNRKIKG